MGKARSQYPVCLRVNEERFIMLTIFNKKSPAGELFRVEKTTEHAGTGLEPVMCGE